MGGARQTERADRSRGRRTEVEDRQRTFMAVPGGVPALSRRPRFPDPHSYTSNAGAGGTSQRTGVWEKGTQERDATAKNDPREGRDKGEEGGKEKRRRGGRKKPSLSQGHGETRSRDRREGD